MNQASPTGCDGRHRIHIRRAGDSASWRIGIGPTGGHCRHAASPGAALDAALAEIGHRDAVIIFGPVMAGEAG